MFLAAGVTPGEAANHKRLIEAAGIDVVLYEGLPITTISFDSTARAIANSGADYVFGLLDETTSASLARSIAQIRYQLKAQEYPVAYGSNFAKLAGPAGNGASGWIDVLPVEDGGKNPEQAQFIKWMRATAPNARTDVFAGAGMDRFEGVPRLHGGAAGTDLPGGDPGSDRAATTTMTPVACWGPSTSDDRRTGAAWWRCSSKLAVGSACSQPPGSSADRRARARLLRSSSSGRARATGGSRCCTASTSPCGPGRSPRCSARTGPARPRPSA